MEATRGRWAMSDPATTPSKRDAKRTAQIVLFAGAVVLLVWFVVANAQKVKVQFWVTSAQTSLIVVILVSAALGALIALLMARGRRRK